MQHDNGVLSALAAAVLSIGAPAAAQDTQALVGTWAGEVTETTGGATTRYSMDVSINLDRHGNPVADVNYTLGCSGVWTEAQAQGRTWRFEETITSGRDNCASHVDGELIADGDTLRVRLHPVGYAEPLAEAVLRRAAETRTSTDAT